MANLTTKELLQRELDKRGISQREMASILGVSEPYVHEILHDKKQAKTKIFDFAEKLGVNLFDKIEVPTRHDKPIPVISWISAGHFTECADHWPAGISGEGDPVFSIKKVGVNSFGLRIVGDSMEPRYMAGDVIVVDPGIHCDNNCPCVIKLNNEVTFKIFYENDTEIKLVSMNEKYPDIIIRKDSKVEFKVIGKIVDMIPKL